MVLQSEMYDVTIVGAGPVGLYATYYAGLRDCKTKLIEMYPQVGGRLISMYPEKEIFDVAGHVKILARDLVIQLTDQAMQYRPTVVLGERVTGLRVRGERVIELSTPNGRHFTQPAAIAAGVTLAHRMYKFQAHEAMVDRLLSSKVKVLFPYFALKEVLGEDRVTGAVIGNERSGKEERIEVDAIVLSIGMLTNLEPFRPRGLNRAGSGVGGGTRTSHNNPAVHAAGDSV